MVGAVWVFARFASLNLKSLYLKKKPSVLDNDNALYGLYVAIVYGNSFTMQIRSIVKMNNVTESVSIIPKRLYSLKNNKGNIPRKLIENIIVNNKYATTIRVSELVYTSRSYRLTSIEKYIYHLYINRTNRIFGRRSKISMEFYHMSDMRKKFDIMQNSESPVVFFPDKHTLCTISSPKIDGFIGMRLVEGDSTACCVEITFVGKNAKKYMCNIKTIMTGDKEDPSKQKTFIDASRPSKRATGNETVFYTVTIQLKKHF